MTAQSQSEPCTDNCWSPAGGLTFRASFARPKMRAGIVSGVDILANKVFVECVLKVQMPKL